MSITLNDIEDGDFLLFRGTAFYSRIIQRWTKSVYSHVGVAHWICSAGRRHLDVLEAMEGSGVRNWPLEAYLDDGVQIDLYKLVDPSVDRSRVVHWFMDRRGKRYASPHQLFRSFVTIPLFEKCGIPTKIDRDRWFCSFAATQSLQYAGWEMPEGDEKPPELISPGETSRFTCLKREGPVPIGELMR